MDVSEEINLGTNERIRLPGNQSAGDQVSGDQEKEDRNSCPDTLRPDIHSLII